MPYVKRHSEKYMNSPRRNRPVSTGLPEQRQVETPAELPDPPKPYTAPANVPASNNRQTSIVPSRRPQIIAPSSSASRSQSDHVRPQIIAPSSSASRSQSDHVRPQIIVPSQSLTAAQQRRQSSLQRVTPEPKGLVKQWREAFESTGKSLKTRAAEAITPDGISRNIRAVGKKTTDFVRDIDERATRLDARRRDEKERDRARKREEWLNLAPEEREAIIKEKYQERTLKEKLRQERKSYDQYNSDRLIASATGAPFHPRVYKVPGGGIFGDDDKYVDEYGREVPGIPEAYQPRGSRRRVKSEVQTLRDIMGGEQEGLPRRRMRSESQVLTDIFGGNGGGGGEVLSGGNEGVRMRQPRIPRGDAMSMGGGQPAQIPPRRRARMPDLSDPMMDLIRI